jgi:hypothetical protein
MTHTFLNFEDSAPEKVVPWDELQGGFGDSAFNYDDAPIVRTAGGSNEQSNRAVTDTLFAGSNLIQETAELERHIKDMSDDGRSYIEMEKMLIGYGYKKNDIRNVFRKLTGVDPVQAYLDVNTFSIPPDSVPRYNYGWGESKKESADYYYVLPYVNQYAVYMQTGLEKEVVFESMVLSDARDELRKYVKTVKVVTPDQLDTMTDIIDRAASVQMPKIASANGQELLAQVHRLKKNGGAELAEKMLNNAKQAGTITIHEHEQLMRYAADTEDPSDMTPEQKDQLQDFERYQKHEEGRTLKEEIDGIKVPQHDFAEKMHDRNRVNMSELTGDAYALLEEITQSITGATIQPVSQSVDLMGVEAFSPDNGNHIDKGSIRFIVEITDAERGESAMGLVIMFIVNGKLQYKGTFKGQNNREYALSTPGVNSYFDDINAGAVDLSEYSPATPPTQEATGPYRA